MTSFLSLIKHSLIFVWLLNLPFWTFCYDIKKVSFSEITLQNILLVIRLVPITLKQNCEKIDLYCTYDDFKKRINYLPPPEEEISSLFVAEDCLLDDGGSTVGSPHCFFSISKWKLLPWSTKIEFIKLHRWTLRNDIG